jgi:hypothetical protein
VQCHDSFRPNITDTIAPYNNRHIVISIDRSSAAAAVKSAPVKIIPKFSEMPKDYQDDVKKKLLELPPICEEIYQLLRELFEDAVLTSRFRRKKIQRILEKDVIDYAGVTSHKTQVKDLFAARLCPSL